jgi:hypothetical protein
VDSGDALGLLIAQGIGYNFLVKNLGVNASVGISWFALSSLSSLSDLCFNMSYTRVLVACHHLVYVLFGSVE